MHSCGSPWHSPKENALIVASATLRAGIDTDSDRATRGLQIYIAHPSRGIASGAIEVQLQSVKATVSVQPEPNPTLVPVPMNDAFPVQFRDPELGTGARMVQARDPRGAQKVLNRHPIEESGAMAQHPCTWHRRRQQSSTRLMQLELQDLGPRLNVNALLTDGKRVHMQAKGNHFSGINEPDLQAMVLQAHAHRSTTLGRPSADPWPTGWTTRETIFLEDSSIGSRVWGCDQRGWRPSKIGLQDSLYPRPPGRRKSVQIATHWRHPYI